MNYQAVIGLEIHVQLKTASKMFCRCDNNAEGAAPNTHICPVCYGLPGALPSPNRRAVELALKAAQAFGCEIPKVSKFDRKQYFYPDLPKGYQISQYDEPLGGKGTFEFDMVGPDGKAQPRTIGITRLHLEEDAGKLTHPKGADYSLVDLNRAGTPLAEIVTDPVEASLEEAPALAKTFLQELRLLMRWLEVSDADMEKGHLRADANISIHPEGSQDWGSKVEIKNLNSFRFVERGLRAEIARQQELLESGKKIAQETRGYDEDTGQTFSQRSKEEAMDYRYFPEPDIPPLEPRELVSTDEVETPVQIRRQWRKAGLSDEVIQSAINKPSLVPTLRALLSLAETDVDALNKTWLGGVTVFEDDPRTLQDFIEVSAPAIRAGSLSPSQVKDLAAKVRASGQRTATLLADDPAFQPVDESDLATSVESAIAANPKAVADYRGGNPNAKQAIVGAVMKATKGSANPTTVLRLIDEKLENR